MLHPKIQVGLRDLYWTGDIHWSKKDNGNFLDDLCQGLLAALGVPCGLNDLEAWHWWCQIGAERNKGNLVSTIEHLPCVGGEGSIKIHLWAL